MNKSEFINEINVKCGLTKKDCKLCLETILNIITETLKNGESVTFSNFGKFKVDNKKAKTMYNFQTRNVEIVDAKRSPTFKASENLKQCLK